MAGLRLGTPARARCPALHRAAHGGRRLISYRGPLVFVPVLGSPLAHAPVLALDLAPALKRPLDLGLEWRGKRLLGPNKTWRGALVMLAGTFGATVLLSRLPAYWRRLPAEIQRAGPIRLGLALGAGVVLGELPNSFLKRRLGLPPGGRSRSATGVLLSIFDQADFVPVVWVLLLPGWRMPAGDALVSFAAVAAVHVPVNLIGYAIGARDTKV